MALPSLSSLWKAAKAVDTVFELDAVVKSAFEKLDFRLSSLERRVQQLESEKREVITEARAAAMTAASAAASAHLSDLARHIGALQEQLRGMKAGPVTEPPAVPRRRIKRALPPEQS